MKIRSPRSIVYVTLALMIIFVAFYSVSILPVKAPSSNLAPAADSWVEASNPNNNYGGQDKLHTRTDSTTRRTYIKFDLSSLPSGQAITSALLKLYCSAASPSSNVEQNVYATSDSWSEATITWNNAPAVEALIVQNTAVGGTGQYISWDVTSYMQAQYAGDKIASMIVRFPNDDPSVNNPDLHRDYYSKEKSGTTYDPYLEIVSVQQYYLTVNSAYDSPTPTSGWFNTGTEITASVTSPWSGPAGTQYICTGWTGTGSVPASGTETSVTFTITQDSSITWNWQIQYYLTVTSPYGTPGGEGWYNDGDTAYATLDTGMVSGPPGVRYVFSHWSVDAFGTNYAQSDPISMTGPKTATAIWQTQYYLTVSSPYGTTGGEGWYPSGDTAYATVTPLIVSGPPGTQYVFIQWSVDAAGNTSPSNPIYMNGPKTAVGNWQTQFYLTVTSAYSSPTPTSGWFNAGQQITASVASPVAGPPGTRYVCTGWTGTGSVPASGTGTSIVFNINAPSSITWNWKTQYLLTVLTDPSGLSPQPTRNPPGEAGPPNWWWYDAHLSVELTAQSVAGYTFDYWDVNGGSQGTGVNPITVAMHGPNIATAHYIVQVQQFYLTVTSPYDSPTPTSGWFDDGTVITASVTSPVSGPAGTRYVCTGWTGTGSVPASGTGTSVIFTIHATSSITWNWQTQYYLTVRTDPLSITTIPGEGWYDASDSRTLTAPPVPNYDFDHWDVDGTSRVGNPITVHMDGPHTATAHYTRRPGVVGGYSVSLDQPAKTAPLVGYAMILMVLGAALTLIRRKRK